MHEYTWRPGHDVVKPNFKVGEVVLYLNQKHIITHVDRHSYPIILKGIGRVKEDQVIKISKIGE